MKTLRDYIVNGALYQGGTGPEAQVGDQIKLFLDTEADPGFPEFVLGVIQHPIVKVQCGAATSYVVEYDEADLLGAAALIRPGDVVDATIVSAVDALAEVVDALAVVVDGATELSTPDTLVKRDENGDTAVNILTAAEIACFGLAATAYLLVTPKTLATLNSDLPAPLTGMRAMITDANATLAAGHGNIAVGSGANLVPVYFDGSDWRIG